MTLHDYPNFNPTDYASHGNAILGIRDSGKTVTAEGLGERLIDAGIPITVIDPIGRWRFLRVPGRGKGFPVVVAGGTDGDLPLTPASAEALTRAAMQNRISIVFDLYAMEISKADWKRICEAVVRTLLYENKRYGLRHIFIEEAAEFAPQRVGPGQGAVYAEIEKLARMGGNALLGYTLINQRAEEVNKAVLELCDTLILHRQKGRNSLANLEKWLKVGSAQSIAEIMKSMPMLKQGEAWAWISSSDEPVRIQFPLKQSFVPDRRAMSGDVATHAGKTVDVGGFIAAMKATLEQAEEADEKPKRGAAVANKLPIPHERRFTEQDLATAVAAAEHRGAERGHRQGVIDALRAFSDDLRALADGWDASEDSIAAVVARVPYDPGTPQPSAWEDMRKRLSTGQPVEQPQLLGFDRARGRDRSVEVHGRSPGNGFAAHHPAGAELRILRVLAARAPARFTHAQWATLAGMKRTGGTWRTYVSRLRTQGLIDEQDGTVGLTAAGRRAAGPVERPAAGSVVEGWKRALGTGPSKMIDALVRAHPHPVDQANLADRCGMVVTGGTFRTYLSRLRTNGLIDVKGRKITASATLFLDGGA